MAPRKGSQLDLAALDQLVNKLDEVYKKLVAAEEGLDRLSKRRLSIQIDPNFIKSLDTILKLLDRFASAPAGAKGIESFARALNTLMRALAFSDGKGNIVSDALRNVSRFIKLFVLLPALFTELTVVFKLISLASVVIPSDSIFKRLTQGMLRLANALNTTNTAFGGGKGQGFAAFRATVASVVRIGVLFPLLFTQLTVIFRAISLASAIVPGQQAFTVLAQGFQSLGTAVDSIDRALGGGKAKGFGALGATFASIIRLGVLFPTLITGLTVLVRGLAVISSIIPGQQAFSKLTDGFHQLGLAFKSINTAFGGGQRTSAAGLTATFAAVIRIGVIFPIIFTQLTVIFRSLSAIVSILPGRNAFLELSEAFRNLGAALVNIRDASKGFNLVSLLRLSLTVRQIGGIFRSLTQSFVKADLVDSFSAVSQGFAHLAQALKDIPNAVGKFNLGSFVKLFVVVAALKRIVANLGKGIPKGQAETIALMANTIAILSTSIRRIVNSLSDLRVRDTINLGPIQKIFNSLRGFVKTLVRLSAKDIRTENLSTITEVVKAVTNVLRVLNSITKLQLGRDQSKIFDGMRKSLNSVVAVVKQFTRIKPTNAKNVGDFVTGIAKLLSSIGRLSTDSSRLDGLIVVSKKIGEAVRNFNVGLLAGRKVKQLRDLANAFAALSGLNVKSLSGFVRSLIALKDVNLRQIDLTGLPKLAKELSAAARQFRNADFSNLGDFTSFAESLSKLAKAQETLRNTTFSTKNVISSSSLTDTIAAGTQRGIQRVLVLQALIKAVLNFNPIALTIKIGRFFESVYNRVKQAIDLVTTLQRRLREAVEFIRDMGDRLASAGSNLLNRFGVGALLRSSAFDAAVGFDTLSTQLQTFGRLTDEQLVRAQDFANQIGIQYPLSANEALGAILQLSKAGRELPEIERILPSAADIAALSDTGSIESATQILIGAQAAFQEFGEGIPATFENINVAADIIANTADATTASIESIQEGLANVGPIAAQYGLSFADVNAIIGTFADSNLRGAEAGTALKSALTNLNTDVAKRELARLGISLTDAQGNFRDFNDIILDLNGALNETQTIRISSLPGVDAANREQVEEAQRVLESATRQLFLWQNGLASGAGDPEKAADKVAEYNRQISAAQQLLTQLTGSQSTAQFITTEVTRSQQQNAESIRKLFGAYGQVAGSILLTNEGFGDLRDQILSSGTAAERAQLLLDNFRGDIEQLSGSVETLATKAFLPLVEKVFRPFVKLGRLVVDSILRMDDRVLEFISTAIAFGSILATVVGAGAILIGTLISIGGNFVLLALRLSSIFFSDRCGGGRSGRPRDWPGSRHGCGGGTRSHRSRCYSGV
ncbi:putative tail protein [Virus Rctr85]|nr:putative tail protein [Virus Rctr85]